jgi:DNA uptake protein ComE-like DNA-binding protein
MELYFAAGCVVAWFILHQLIVFFQFSFTSSLFVHLSHFILMKKSSTPNHYQRSERRGFIVLVLIALILLAIPAIKGVFHKPTSIVLENETKSIDTDQETVGYKPFDPNTDSESELVAAGLPAKVAASLVRYRNKGGRFYQPDDLLKLYVMTPQLYEKLEPYVRISLRKSGSYPKPAYRKQPAYQNRPTYQPQARAYNDYESKIRSEAQRTMPQSYGYQPQAPTWRSEPQTRQPRAVSPVDVNVADFEAWTNLPGIGKFYAGKILRFRESLGGFSSLEQIATCYGLPDSVYSSMLPWLRFETAPRLLDYNNMTVDELSAHPYLSKRQATALVNARIQAGGTLTLNQLQKLIVFDAADWAKIKPYVTPTTNKEVVDR